MPPHGRQTLVVVVDSSEMDKTMRLVNMQTLVEVEGVRKTAAQTNLRQETIICKKTAAR